MITMELKEARMIAEETFRVIATHPDAYNIRQFVGAEIDLSDEAMIEALNMLDDFETRASVGDIRRNGEMLCE